LSRQYLLLSGGSLLGASLLLSHSALAGPPFLTDDPEPVDYQHWEIDLLSIGTSTQDNKSGFLPGIEVNYGIVPDVQLHIIAPLAVAATNGQPFHYGYGDTELGVKYRFIHEDEEGWRPQIGVFPLVDVPTGDSHNNLGTGTTREFLPV
jgi:hypothetical protein